MAYIFKFKQTDKVINLVRTYPRVSFAFYNGTASYNNQFKLAGQFTSSILGAPEGYLSLYDQNIDRKGTLSFNDAATQAIGTDDYDGDRDPFGFAVATGIDPTTFYDGANPRYATFKVKDGTRINFKTVSRNEFNLTVGGTPFFNYYPLTSSVQKIYYSPLAPRWTPSALEASEPEVPADTGSISYLMALANTLDYYQILNPKYAVNDGVRNLTASSGVSPHAALAVEVGLLTIPTIFYGDTIKKGTVDLKFFVTGTLVGQLKDINRNGSLIQVGPSGSNYSGSTAGVVLYNEGFIVLTGSHDLTLGGSVLGPSRVESYGTDHDFPNWINFAQTISSSVAPTTTSACTMDFSGSHKIPTLMLFATAPKNQLNHSNNPTYRDKSSVLLVTSGSTGYIQNNKALIKNTVSSSYNDPTGSFQKTTYISKVGIYDVNKNLIAIAKVATPVKKLEERELTFKLKLDM